MAYVNKMDIMGADFYNVLQMMNDRSEMQRCSDSAADRCRKTFFKGIIDLVEMKADVYYDDTGQGYHGGRNPGGYEGAGGRISCRDDRGMSQSTDEELMEKYLEGEELTIEEIKAAIRKATIANTMVPVTCGTSYSNKGVQKLLDAIVDYMPAPTDIPAIKGVNPETERGGGTSILPTMSRSQLWHLRLLPTRLWVSCASSVYIPVRSTAGATVYNSVKDDTRAYGPYPADARKPPEGY